MSSKGMTEVLTHLKRQERFFSLREVVGGMEDGSGSTRVYHSNNILLLELFQTDLPVDNIIRTSAVLRFYRRFFRICWTLFSWGNWSKDQFVRTNAEGFFSVA